MVIITVQRGRHCKSSKKVDVTVRSTLQVPLKLKTPPNGVFSPSQFHTADWFQTGSEYEPQHVSMNTESACIWGSKRSIHSPMWQAADIFDFSINKSHEISQSWHSYQLTPSPLIPVKDTLQGCFFWSWLVAKVHLCYMYMMTNSIWHSTASLSKSYKVGLFLIKLCFQCPAHRKGKQ